VNFNKKLSKLNSNYNYENKYELVSAGSITEECSEALICINGSFFEHDGENINADKYTVMVVDGDAMNKFGIKDGDVIFVDKDSNLSYKESPIFVLHVTHDEKNNIKIKYKLRKAIDFYDCKETFDIWIKNHPELDAVKLREKYKTKQAEITECKRLGCRLLISETTKDGDSYYSFHPESYIYGKVKYRIPNETVEIIEKKINS
jgi:hypothetical protein